MLKNITLCFGHHCPGMLRCGNSYSNFICLDLLAECVGQTECIGGKDESNCDEFTFPAVLKCRGERRCVSPVEVSHAVQRGQSYDDELDSGHCPDDCQCSNYTIICETFAAIINMSKSAEKIYAKSLKINGEIKDFVTYFGFTSAYSCRSNFQQHKTY